MLNLSFENDKKPTPLKFLQTKKRKTVMPETVSVSYLYAGANALSFFCNIHRLGSLGAFGNFELNGIPFVECTESIALDCGIMYKNIFSVFCSDEPITFDFIEPLYFTGGHT
jgi:hypothetical protein